MLPPQCEQGFRHERANSLECALLSELAWREKISDLREEKKSAKKNRNSWRIMRKCGRNTKQEKSEETLAKCLPNFL